jgi:malate dehydrogenase (oxaloacetate-decarboxylating)
MLDAQAHEYTEPMALAAARAIADSVGEERLNASVIVPSVFDARVAPAVAEAVRAAANLAGAAPTSRPSPGAMRLPPARTPTSAGAPGVDVHHPLVAERSD